MHNHRESALYYINIVTIVKSHICTWRVLQPSCIWTDCPLHMTWKNNRSVALFSGLPCVLFFQFVFSIIHFPWMNKGGREEKSYWGTCDTYRQGFNTAHTKALWSADFKYGFHGESYIWSVVLSYKIEAPCIKVHSLPIGVAQSCMVPLIMHSVPLVQYNLLHAVFSKKWVYHCTGIACSYITKTYSSCGVWLRYSTSLK